MERKDLFRGALISAVIALGTIAKTDSAKLEETDCPVTNQLSDEYQQDLKGVEQAPFQIVNKNRFEKASGNLEATITWMKSLGSADIREAAVCVEDEINETNFLISANSKKAALVRVAPNPQRPQVLFSIKALSGEQFTRAEGAVDIFEAYYIYKKALEDPKEFTSDLANKLHSLEGEAAVASSQAFASVELVNHK